MSEIDAVAKNMPFSRAVQAACVRLGRKEKRVCRFPHCECRDVPDAIRDAFSEWVKTLPTDGAASGSTKVRHP